MDKINKQQHLLIIITSVFLFSQIVVFSWLSDDAFITMRSVDNLIHGFGPTWNIGERVQSFTHPLWMLLLTLVYMLVPNEVLTPVLLSLVFAVGTIVVVI